ncbi:MAG: hypothetical protein Q9166_000257 [cf. Caloplaca sp. 2 TL-2023]
MSFFGQNNNQQSSGFGGFGSSSNTGTGFGQPSNTGFGASTGTTGGGLFGTSNNNTNTGFGGFGAAGSTSSPFGGTTAFGTNTSSGGGMFGSNTATAGNSTGFGSFGGNNTNTGGGLFGGGNKPAFGTPQPTTGGSLFGGGSNAFGTSNNQTSGFGAAPTSSALASNTAECQGTGSTPFQAFTEKEGVNGSQTNHFQSITFMQPYKNFSFEELRLADYNQGRRYGNGSGQAGAFGTSTGFGGFGGQNTGGGFGTNNQSTSLFGTQTTSASPFGGAQTATSGFGASNTGGGGLFGSGAAKPTGFGTTTSQSTGGGLFGNANQSGGFGTQNNTNTGGGFGSNQGGGLFGNNSNQQKSGFSFGQSNNTGTGTGFGTSGNTGFGTNNNTSTGGGLFGTNATNAPFVGGQQQPASNPFGGFGNNQQNQNQTQNTTGSGFGGFGSNNQQQKPGGLFGTDNSTSNTGGGLFGNNNQNNQQSTTGGGLFGNANNNQTGGSSLFGAKPAATGTGLFGNNNTTNTGNTGGGLFGSSNNNQNQQNQSGGLFGNNNQQQPKPGGLFGGGNSLFGNNNNQQQGATSSLFGGGLGSNNQQQQSSGLFGTSNNNNNTSSLFNNPQQQQQQQPQANPLSAPQAYTASIFDSNPYGNRSIFDGLPPPPQQHTGPIATPIGQKNKEKKGGLLPQYRINPHVASRFVTPQKRQGYGFSYSTYGTPSSVSSNVSTPGGLGSSLLQGSISRSLGKSLSTTNLRRSFDTEGESLLSPGAFSAGSSRYNGTGSLKKLTIDRSLRTDLFSAPPPLPSSERNDQSRQPSILKKKVSFDASTVGGNGDGQDGAQANGINGTNAESSNSQTSEQGSSQPNGLQNGSRDDRASTQPEMEQVRGNELAVINEDGSQDMQSVDGSHQSSQPSQRDPQPGAYYMEPSPEEVARMSFEQKKSVPNVRIGRERCGFVTFDRPVNLNEVPMDRIFGGIAQIDLRTLTIYPDTVKKPMRGKGLNVPSTIHLSNSWPRAKDHVTPLFEKSGPRFNKHLQRLQRVRDTQFVSYDKDTGVWVFKVEHFTTYGLDYEDEDDTFQTSTLSAPPDSPTPQSRLPRAGSTPMPTGPVQDSSLLSSEWSQSSTGPDDTFEFRRQKVLPGAFDDSAVFDEGQDENTEMAEVNEDSSSFLGERSAALASANGEPSNLSDTSHLNRSQSLVVREEQFDMAGSFPGIDGAFEQENPMARPTSHVFGTPAKLEFNKDGDWAEELRRTISPRKQDRQALRESQARVLQQHIDKDNSISEAYTKRDAVQPGFATAMDLMHSLNPKEPEMRKKGKKGTVGQGKAFQYPYAKRLSTNDDDNEAMREDNQEWHDSFKPSWGPEATLLYASPTTVRPSDQDAAQTNGPIHNIKTKLVSEGRDVCFAKFTNTPSLTPSSLSLQKSRTTIVLDQGIPSATPRQIPFKELASTVESSSRIEKSVWDLASILFDELNSVDFGSAQAPKYEYRVRKDLLSDFWSSICTEKAQKAVTSATSAEERAIAHLTANDIVKACEVLVEAKDFRLATLIAQLPADQIMAEDMASQIKEWRDLCVLSEMTEPVRALYELCSGDVCICEGTKGPIEDQARTFVISQRFGLDWKRAFGLRLWYATRTEESIEAAVKLYHDNINNDEPAKPLPDFVEGTSEHDNEGEDIHWGLLKLFAASKDAIPSPPLADIVMPRNLADNPVDSRFSFQLYNALSHLFPHSTDQTKVDHLSFDFASQLESQGEWLWSIFVLLHLSDPDQRQKVIQNILGHHAVDITPDDTAFPFSYLVSDFKIPARWVWEAKALEARSVAQNYANEITYLQNANNWTEAHQTLCRVVGPQCVIEQDYETLGKLLKGFDEGVERIAEAWQYGGEVYEDYLDVIEGKTTKEQLDRMLDTLAHLLQSRKGKFGFEEGIAIGEIAGEVADAVAKGGYQEVDFSRILQLPLTSEQRRRHSVEMSMQHYRNIMRGTKA